MGKCERNWEKRNCKNVNIRKKYNRVEKGASFRITLSETFLSVVIQTDLGWSLEALQRDE